MSNIDKTLLKEKKRYENLFAEIATSLSDKYLYTNNDDNKNSWWLEPVDVLQHLLDFTRNHLHAEKCALFLVDSSKKSLVLERISGDVNFNKIKDVATYDLASASDAQGGVTPWVLFRKKSFNAKSFQELIDNSEGHWKGNWDTPMYGSCDEAERKFKCLYMVPLIVDNKSIGVLKYENCIHDKNFFDDNDERLIDMIAVLITNLVISQRVERSRYDKMLPIISSALVAHFDKPSFYEELLERCQLILSAEFCSLFLLDDRKNLFLKSIVGVDDKKKEKLKGFAYSDYTNAKGLTPWILTREMSYNIRSYPDLKSKSQHKGCWDEIVYDNEPENKFKSLYSIPLIIDKEHIGVFKVENKSIPPYYFTESDELLFDLIGRLIAIGVKYEKTREMEQYLGKMAKSAELGFLAAGISHEFNNYLQEFLVSFENAIDICHDECVINKFESIKSNIFRAAKMINDFRDLLNQNQNITEFNLDELLSNIILLSKQRFEHHNINIIYKNYGVYTVCLNQTDLQTIVINLINNAFESTLDVKDNGVADVMVKVDQSATIDEFFIEVSDSGKGISVDNQKSIFTPFYTTKSTGMGVGLFLVHRFVTSMNGHISVESPNDRGGATFKVYLPINTIN